jgi:outer membrane lipoprotein-sorting protein
MRYQIRSLCCILLFLFLVPEPGGPLAEEPSNEAHRITSIMDKVIDAYGGKDAIEGIRSLRVTGKIEAFMLRDHGTYEYYFKRGRKLRVETKYGRSSELRILDGDKGYRGTDTLPVEEVSGPRYLAIVYQYKHLNILHDIMTGVYQIGLAGGPVVSEHVEVFRLVDKEGAVMDIFVDKQTFFIIKVAAYFTSDNKQIDLAVEFSDFKKVGSSVFPFRITNYAGGLKVAQTVIEKYSLNPDIADSFFAPTPIHSL